MRLASTTPPRRDAEGSEDQVAWQSVQGPPVLRASASAYATEQTIQHKSVALKEYQQALIEGDTAVANDPALARQELTAHTQLIPAALKGLGLPDYDVYVIPSSVTDVLNSM
jgi:hypothetical protein